MTVTGWEDDWMGDDWPGLGGRLSLETRRTSLETTARVTRIHATDGERD
jgi:hypothetical protein